ASWFNNTRSIILSIQRQPGTNTIEVVDSIKKLLPSFRAQMPASVNMEILNDRSMTIRDSIADVKFTLALTVALVVMVIFLFLRNLSATVIPSLAVPLSIFGTFGVMYLLGYSMNNLSLMALTLSVGFVVDDAIVMVENIVRHMELGERPFEAALNGAREIGFTILSMTVSLAAVFLPVLFMGGLLGRLLHEFAVTIGAAILVSGFVSLTLTPMLCSRFLRSQHQQRHGWLFTAFENGYQAIEHFYERTLRFALRRRLATMTIGLGMFVAAAWIYARTPKGFLPSQDSGTLFAFTQAQEGISFEAMGAHQRQVIDIVQQQPYVAGCFSFFGGGFVATNQGIFFVQLTPRNTRPHVDQIITDLRAKLAVVPGMMVFMQNLPPIQVGGQLTKAQYQLTLQSTDTTELYHYAGELEKRVR